MADTKRVRNMPNDASLPEWLLGEVRKTLEAAGLLLHHGTGAQVTTANSSSLATSKTLAKSLADTFAAHGSSTALHSAADSTLGTLAAAYTSTPAEPADLTQVQNIANELKTEFNSHLLHATAHRSVPGSQGGAAALVPIATANATDQATADALLNALKAAYNRHVNMGLADFLVD